MIIQGIMSGLTKAQKTAFKEVLSEIGIYFEVGNEPA